VKTASPGRRLLAFQVLALVGLVSMLVVVAYYPFTWDPPRSVRNTVTRQADGSLRFGTMNRARTGGDPSWLDAARRSGRVEIHLVVLPDFPQAESDAAIMLLARDYWRLDFRISETDSRMTLQLRRTGSNVEGEPPIDVDGAFRPGHWTTIDVVFGDRVTVAIDGEQRAVQRFGAGSFDLWSGGRLALGAEVNGGGSWQGRIRTAEVRTSAGSVDYVAPGALTVPASYVLLPDHVTPFPPPTPTEWLVLLIHFVSFIPLGYLLVTSRWFRGDVRSATFAAGALALALAAGKFVFPRHTAVADVVVQVIGAFVGALIATHGRLTPGQPRAGLHLGRDLPARGDRGRRDERQPDRKPLP
jgi:VanZ family protein